MDEETIVLKGKRLKQFSNFKTQFKELGLTPLTVRKDKLVLERIETTDLKGQTHHFYRLSFFPNKLVFTYSFGQNKKKHRLEATALLLNLIKVSQEFFSVDGSELYSLLLPILNDAIIFTDSQDYAILEKFSELSEKFSSLEKKYKDVVISSEQNARLLLECEKKKEEYYARIKQLEGMSDESLRQELFKWLKTHNGEIILSQFVKFYNLSTTRVEEGLEYLLRNGYIRKRKQ